ncbi:hypothetical protein HU751_005155 [Pseudomonas sp. BW13M1]|uniref:Uncharacterized protein n=1 Tax=Pseudomonas peradeniyensis TaxID=2745488 RepID=A0A923GE10_9PSED|nr:hypothetical protein [Pseudomonas peradeniyensis]MBV4504228.1 hypothetical protein [Pseudomonas peradeniyensis]
MKKIILTFIILMLVSIGVIAILIYTGAANKTSSANDTVKAILQVVIVSGFGAWVSVLMSDYQLRQQAKEKEREVRRMKLEYREVLLKSVLSRAMDAYGKAKTARRLFRGRGVASNSRHLVLEQYDHFFDQINAAQLELEVLARDVRASDRTFSEPGGLDQNISKMEKYLGELISEYEQLRPQFSDPMTSFTISDLPRLEDYIRPSAQSEFKPSMITPFQGIQASIRKDLLNPSL